MYLIAVQVHDAVLVTGFQESFATQGKATILNNRDRLCGLCPGKLQVQVTVTKSAV